MCRFGRNAASCAAFAGMEGGRMHRGVGLSDCSSVEPFDCFFEDASVTDVFFTVVAPWSASWAPEVVEFGEEGFDFACELGIAVDAAPEIHAVVGEGLARKRVVSGEWVAEWASSADVEFMNWSRAP